MAINRPIERTGRSSKKNRQREQLILAMLQQPNLEKAAASIGISLSTAYRTRKTLEFQAEYLEARRDSVSQAIARLQHGCGAAASTLLKVMLDPATPAASRVQAADRVLQHSESHLELEDFELRLRRLEQSPRAGSVETKAGQPAPVLPAGSSADEGSVA
jgi:hypothetical protein